MNSCVYEGTIRHRRFLPQSHSFQYKLFMLYLDLSELDEVFSGSLFWSTRRAAPARFHRKDYFGDPRVPLERAIRRHVKESAGVEVTGPIRLLTHLRYFGYCFNPVSFYYCFDEEGTRLEAIVAEITNTPWNERHAYVLTEGLNRGNGSKKDYRFDKAFHVSPFIDMDQRYRWFFNTPGEALTVHMDNLTLEGKLFDATLNLKRRAITGAGLNLLFLKFPFMTGKVVAGIYWNALKLWLKGFPFHAHPRSRSGDLEAGL